MKATFIYLTLSALLSGTSWADRTTPPHGHLSDWSGIPMMIEAMKKDPNELPLDQLHQLTFIRLGTADIHNLKPDEQRQWIQHTRQSWLDWWKSTGQPISTAKDKHAKVDQTAFRLAWSFLHASNEPPNHIPPVWIPPTWTLYITFKTGDYGALEELWILERKESEASLTKLSNNSSWNQSSIELLTLKDFSPADADRTLKAIHYLHRFAPNSGKGIVDDEMPKLYYPNAGLRLVDGQDRLLWNTRSYEFTKSVPDYGDGIAGRTVYFMHSVFNDPEQWAKLANPDSSQLMTHRKFLSFSKPWLSHQTSIVIELFAEIGNTAEIEAMFDWSEKQKAAVDRGMHWQVRTDEFRVGAIENMVNSTRFNLTSNMKNLQKAIHRLETQEEPELDEKVLQQHKDRLRELELYVADMHALEKKEEEDEIMGFPQPLRALVRVDRQHRDPDLKNLNQAIQKIRGNPDPKLFSQLAAELDEGTLRMRSLMSYLLFNQHGLSDMKAWEPKQEAIAVEACIGALAHINQRCREIMIIMLLRVCDGGTIEIQEEDGGGRKIKVPPNSNGGYSLSHSDDPVTVAKVQDQLRHLYKESRKKR